MFLHRKDSTVNRTDVRNMVGTIPRGSLDYAPLACLLKSGYGCVGYYNSSINSELEETLVLLNMRLVDLRPDETSGHRMRVSDFNDFLQEIVTRHLRHNDDEFGSSEGRNDGTIPLAAVPVSEIAILYPVARIATLLKTASGLTEAAEESGKSGVPVFLDFNNRSIVLKVLRTKLW